MEAIGGFLNVAKIYLPSSEVFMTIDLFENQNMAQVFLYFIFIYLFHIFMSLKPF